MGEATDTSLGKGFKEPICLFYQALCEGNANLSEPKKRTVYQPFLVLFNQGKTVADEHRW